MDLDAVLDRPDRVLFEGRSGAILAFALDPHVPERDAFGLRRASVALRLPEISAYGTLFFFEAQAVRFVERATEAHARRRGSTTLVSENRDFRLKVAYGTGGLIGLAGHFRPSILSSATVVFEMFPDEEGLRAAFLALRRALAP